MFKTFVVLGLAVLGAAREFTVYNVRGTFQPDPTESTTSNPIPEFTMSAVGVGSDGRTTYDAVYQYTGRDTELVPTSLFTVSRVADDTHIGYTYAGPALLVDGAGPTTITQTIQETVGLDCSWGPERNLGTCVRQIGPRTRTYTGSVAAFYTVTVENSASNHHFQGATFAMYASLLGVGLGLGLARVLAL
ncbi:hypothetical protein ONZ45_g1423 [Pleurotus djamor]|nr:hypothetical protein ONZ45_g1423 [Pleurotus djamor]